MSDKLAFTDWQNIYTINRDGTELQRITNNTLPIYFEGFVLSGDAKKVAYKAEFPSYEEFSVINADGSNKVIISTATTGYFFSWAPHPTKLLYTENGKIYSYSVETNYKVQLTTGPDDKSPVWSPDLKRIAYISSGMLSIMDADGKNKKTILKCPISSTFRKLSGSSREIFYAHKKVNPFFKNQHSVYRKDRIPSVSVSGELKWSEDSNKIVYYSNGDFWIINLQNFKVTQITQLLSYYYCWDYDLSPDGTKIVYNLGEETLWTINIDGTGNKKIYTLADSREFLGDCLWKGNNKIYFTKEEERPYISQLCSINPDGTGIEEKTSENILSWFFDVSSDGKTYIYGAYGLWIYGEPLVIRPAQRQIKVIGSKEGRGTVNPERGDKAKIFFTGSAAGEYHLRIFTQLGELVYEDTKEIESNEDWFEWIPESIASGIYIVHIEGPGIKNFSKIAILR